jgi:hypothetical protein
MGNLSKDCMLIFVALLALTSLIVIEPVNAQSTIPTPSPYIPGSTATPLVPEFSVQTIKNDNGSITIEVKIKNQPLSFIDYKGSSWANLNSPFFYNIRLKAHDSNDSNDWTCLSDSFLPQNSEYSIFNFTEPYSSETGFMTFIYPATIPGTWSSISQIYISFPLNSQLDFQVQALIGSFTPEDNSNWGSNYVFVGQTSDWSNTQTITLCIDTNSSAPKTTAVPTTSAVSSQNSTATPQTPINSGSMFNLSVEQIALVVMAVVIAVLAVALVVLLRKIQTDNCAKPVIP